MKKKNFVSMIMGTVGGLLFALGMCMCLMSEWNVFTYGVILGILGAVILIAMLIVRRKMSGKPAVKLTIKTVGTAILAVIGTLVFGVGMCMVMVLDEMMFSGIIVGMIGIILMLCLIPAIKGIK